MKRYDPQMRQAAINLRAKGKRTYEIARMLGLDNRTVDGWLAMEDPVRREKRRLAQRARRARNASPCVDCGKPAPTGERCESCYLGRKTTLPEKYAQVIELLKEERWTVNEIAAMVDTPKTNVRKWAATEGLKPIPDKLGPRRRKPDGRFVGAVKQVH